MTKNIKRSNPLYIRIPDGIKERLDSAADKNMRSLNSEVSYRLQSSFDPLSEYPIADLLENIMSRCEPGEFAFRFGNIRKVKPKT
ncbi:Arc family DNA-binding protein [Glaciimonas immobilis]|uniref:Arc family DNA-binding protein n=1 Tax=Glaciimonas immobilis TaxID=728004 RepID=UPI00143A7A5F|nr:Arc family DNA-binding protein [Glaciimonas immobilis]